MNSTKRKINILQVVNGLAIGGGELKLLELVKVLHEKRNDRYHVVVCSVGQDGPLYSEFKKLGIKIFIVQKKHKFDITQVYKVYKIIKQEKIDLVQTTLFYADIIGTLSAKLADIQSIISWETVSRPSESHENKLRHKFAYKICMNFVSQIISVSDAVKRFLVKECKIRPEKIQTIHYGIDLSQFNRRNGFLSIEKRSELGFAKNDIVIGTVARLTNQKGHRYLVEAAPMILEKCPNVQFVFAGNGPLRKDLENQVDRLGLQKYFHFLGFRRDIQNLLYTFNLFVLPSLFEGLPNVILEAMASGRPVVATTVDGVPELLINGKTGILVPPKSSKALANAIIEVLQKEDKGQSMGAKGRIHVEKNFPYEKQFQKFEHVYEMILGTDNL